MVALGGIYRVNYEGSTLKAKLYGEHSELFDWRRCDSCGKEAYHFFTFMSLGSPYRSTGSDIIACETCFEKADLLVESVCFEGAIIEEVE